MPRRGFYNENDDSETEAYDQEVSHSRSRSHRRGREDRRQSERSRSGGATGRGERGERPRSFVGQAFGEAVDAPAPAEGLSQEVEDELANRVAASVTANLGSQLRDILAERESRAEAMAKEVESLRAAQQHASLLTEATELHSESAQKQFIAFAKIQSGVAEVRRLMGAGDLAAADAALGEMEKVADFRLDMVRRADSLPGGWAAANIYERRVAGQSETKNDKIWKSAVEEAA